MLTPAVANFITQFYPLGNTPAVNLTRGLPQGLDGDILLLGCGDARNILFTAYSEQGLPPRNLDITCCDIEAGIIARNVLLFSLVADQGESIDSGTAWNIYYHLYLDSTSEKVVQTQVGKLLRASNSLEEWKQSSFGTLLSFCDGESLSLVRDVWIKYAAVSGPTAKATFVKDLQRSKDMATAKLGSNNVTILTGLRSAAPLALASMDQIPTAYEHYWKHGSLDGSEADLPNPLFAGVLSPNTLLHYATDPLVGFHLATAFAQLAPLSPLRPDNALGVSGVVCAARTQFDQWISAFQATTRKGAVKLRFTVSDALSFCHVLQMPLESSGTHANLYRRQFDVSTCNLDSESYGLSSSAPQEFDVIDTSNLADYFGTLNLLVAATPLLKSSPSSTLYLETLHKTTEKRQAEFDFLLKGHAPTVSLLLGVSSVEYWTNATAVSSVDEMLINLTVGAGNKNDESQIHSRLSWKRTQHLSGRSEPFTRPFMEPSALAKVLFHIYLEMFAHDNPYEMFNLSSKEVAQKMRNSAYPAFHRGSLVTLMKLARSTIDSSWDTACQNLIKLISDDKKLTLGNLYIQEFCLQLHMQGLYSQTWLKTEIRPNPSMGGFNAWSIIPEAVVVNLVVPRSHVNKLHATQSTKHNAPTLQGHLTSSGSSPQAWQNIFADIHLAFGKVKTSGLPDKDDFAISISQDDEGWAGNLPLIASFYVPAAALQVESKTARVALGVQTTPQNLVVFKDAGLGPHLMIYDTSISDSAQVFVTKYLPGMTGSPVVGGKTLLEHQPEEAQTGLEADKITVAAIIDDSLGRIISFTGRVDIRSRKGKQFLLDKIPIELRQTTPFTIDVVFGDNALITSITYPLPVSQARSKTRIARKSSYVEVIAALSNIIKDESLSEFIFPTVLGPEAVPMTLNSNHLSLDTLPILNVEPAAKKANQWLNTLASHQFSVRERRLRDSPESESETGISTNLRLNFKESLFTVFMLAAGLQGGQTGLFALQHPEHGNVMLLFVQAIRIDGAAASVVADAAILPITRSLVDSRKLETFFLVLRELQICVINVNDEELRLWKRALPALVERCRTWSHTTDCEYRKASATIPLSLDPEKQFLCSCGNGKLPEGFMSLPEWEVASQHSVRVAISPTFSVPFVEDIIDVDVFKLAGGLGSLQVEKCRKCGKTKDANGGKLMQCSRCREVAYCSKECQKADWKKHRMECS